ncbi:Enoyl-CoA hydratase/carnithine racemase [Mycobacterium rhizamassiliense]|uniref:Enoyl-CoA hydratase/carnithine racemase n=2 Tax=Mycobacterium TaxID=1763 RepID=A0A2U3PA41_9MYCO|nr:MULTISPECIES: enoyl-CoA hydratase-related protein [Mycobacterium]SPM34817.1 Enoyl-CoA hydratase/carnithine racemase [Mycobacterium rhizamassiliense]SPM40644.1 Enoyl-CoA hydratase/carnithine racemase [Mycobacterium numidiamassiliense]
MNTAFTELQTLTVTQLAEGVALITLNRPERLNTMTVAMFNELEETARFIGADGDVRVVILTGAGKAFCAGYDLDDAEGLPELSPLGMLERQENAARALVAVRAIPVPVIAAVNGAAAGGGFSLSLMADIRLGSPTAKFNAAFVRIGLSAGDLGASWLLPRLIGPAQAADIAYTGRIVEAGEAERLGLLNAVTGPDDLLDRALAMARQISANSPGGIKLSKRALQANMEVGSFAAALELESRGQALLTRCADMPEALAAFREKRAPNFTGR